MNGSTFATYENYFPATNHQMTEGNPLTQNTDYEEVPATIHYLNNLPSDIAPLSQTASVDPRHQQANLYSFVANACEEQQQKHDGQCSTNGAGSSDALTAVGNSGNAFGNIPFVQIHTTNVQQQRTSYGNVFRRNISRQEEIKSEPIKSENSEAAKDRTNATPTPPRGTTLTQNESNGEAIAANEKQSTNINNNNIEEKSCTILQIYKCSQCPFISLRDTERDEHAASHHGETVGAKHEERQPINCPGCRNVFYSQESLKIHLKVDHLMRDDDVLQLINAYTESTTITTESACCQPLEITTSQEPVRKSRIYLKNVDCLREPNRQPMEQNGNQLTENNASNSLEPAKPNPPKQKISIKSVDVLREPALLKRDYEMQGSSLNNFINFNTDLLNNGMDLISSPMNLNTSNSYDYTQNLDNSINKSNLNNNGNNSNNSNKTRIDIEVVEKPRRPKIYVKSVESFNLMPIDSLHTGNNTGYLNDHGSSCNNSESYNTNVVHLPYMFDSSSTGSNINSNANFINNHNDMDTFQFINPSNPNNSFVLDNSVFLCNSEDLNENCEQMENISLIPDTQTPLPPQTTDINSVLNKSATSIQEQRGTLHLRTVDELNLMNKTEVQHLIAPNLDNNHSTDVMDKINSSSLSDITLIGDDLYEDENFKFHDLDTQMVNDWPETYEDLAEDIDCIIADASNENSAENITYTADNNTQKINNSNFDIDTPQVSLITIRDIEELTGTSNHTSMHNMTDRQQDSVMEQIQDNNNVVSPDVGIVNQQTLVVKETNDESESDTNLKRELVNSTPESNEPLQVTKANDTTETSKTLPSISEIPPLVPVTNTINDMSEANSETIKNSLPNSDIPLPPLVPVSPLIKIKNAANILTNKPGSPFEKGRIYVANNLMEPPKRPVAVSATSGTSVRGRPFGSNRTRITKLKQTIGSSAEELFSKCSVKGCAFRFKKAETVEYHRKCHDMTSDSPQAMLCPECKSVDFNNWNTLHTHLWRAHQIDMELYKCELCEFKTPIFSRLVNTHAKIHFDDRNYKCDQCEKAFKNSKQLKNHRRWHRVQVAASDVSNIPKATPTEIYRCFECGSTFSQQKTLREHCCKKGESSLKCSVCEKLMSSKSSLKLHLLTHSDGEKRYKCQNCDYATNDHNAFRRHRMGHENRKMYECNFCPYKSVQSVAYQKHILQKHPEEADSVIHKCTICTFSTINRSLLIVHQAKHEKTSEDLSKIKSLEDSLTDKTTEKSVYINATELQKSKIKVKSNLFTTKITESLENINNNELNLVQLYNVDSDSIT